MKFLLGGFALIAATSAGAAEYAPYPIKNGVPDYGSDAYRDYSSRMDDERMDRSLEHALDQVEQPRVIDAHGGHDVIEQYGIPEPE